MKLISIGEGILVAVLLTLLIIPIRLGTSIFMLGGFGIKMGLGLILLSYVFYLLSRRKNQTGRFFVGLLTLVWIIATSFLPIGPVTLSFFHVAYIWFIRSVLTYRSFIPSFFDGVLTATSLSLAIVSYMVMGSLMAAVWVFFLTQSLHVLIASGFKSFPTKEVKGTTSQQFGFDQAMRTAEAALTQIR